MAVRGTVKWFSSQKGYGFIEVPGGEDVFAHYSDIVEADGIFRFLERGSTVEFDMVAGERGPRAVHIVKIQTDTPAPPAP